MDFLKFHTGAKIPALGLGTWQAKGKKIEDAVYHAIKSGYRLIDTATIYGNEEDVGRAIRRAMVDFKIKREELFITTKLWNTDHGDPATAFNKSLSKLGLDYVDLYLLHWPVATWQTGWQKMQALKGKTKALGVSNFDVEQLQQMIDQKMPMPAVNQIEFSPYLYRKDILEFCKKNNVLIEAYSPLTRGKKLDEPRLLKIAEKYDKSPAQILLRWCVQHGTVPIPKSTNPQRIEENFNIFDFELSKEDMIVLDSFDEGHFTYFSTKTTSKILDFGRRLGI